MLAVDERLYTEPPSHVELVETSRWRVTLYCVAVGENFLRPSPNSKMFSETFYEMFTMGYCDQLRDRRRKECMEYVGGFAFWIPILGVVS